MLFTITIYYICHIVNILRYYLLLYVIRTYVNIYNSRVVYDPLFEAGVMGSKP